MRIGINTGPVVVGAIRGPAHGLHRGGDTDQFAARLLNIAKRDRAWSAAYSSIRDGSSLRGLGEFEVKAGRTHSRGRVTEKAGAARIEVSKDRGLHAAHRP